MRRSWPVGLFFDPPKKAEKPHPPEPTWLSPNYLPGLEEARLFPIDLMNDGELEASVGDTLVVDTEVYPNYFLAAFRSQTTGKITYLESPDLDIAKLKWIVDNFLLVSFNGIAFDIPILAMAISGASCTKIHQACELLITDGKRGNEVLRAFGVKQIHPNHIDLIEVAPLDASLKIYTGRLHCKKIQDLPFQPGTNLSDDQIAIVRYYCCNDLENTALLCEALRNAIDLRCQLSTDYNMDLRSKSDAQIAEAVITHEVSNLNGFRAKRPEVEVGKRHFYKAPKFIQYQSDLLKYALNIVETSAFVVQENGGFELPEAIKSLKFDINGTTYRMGQGGLHSCESSVNYQSNSEYVLIDRDVASYYPAIILNNNLYPEQLGTKFLMVYGSLRSRRLAAKKAKNTRVANSLKITINGGFGKFGSKWSMLYSPSLLIGVTITGQLSLLMLIERIEFAGIHIISGNTDGIVIYCPRDRENVLNSIIAQWEKETGFETEETRYTAIYSRDVNNYIALKEDGKTKGKGIFGNPWKSGDSVEQLQKSPQNTICVEAVTAFLQHGTALVDTISQCRDISKFVSLRTVKGGAVKDGVYLGKAVRWYFSTTSPGAIVYAASGNKVPTTDGAKPLMVLPDEFPADIDYAWYFNEAESMLRGLGI